MLWQIPDIATIGNGYVIDSVFKAENTQIPENITALATCGYYQGGDGGAAIYKKVNSQPNHFAKFQSGDGAWWELANQVFNANMFGAKGDGSTNDGPIINEALQYIYNLSNTDVTGGTLNFLSATYCTNETIIVPDKLILKGQGTPATCIKALSTFNSDALVKNERQDGTQEWASIEGMTLDGNARSGAICSNAVLEFISLFINSYAKELLVFDGSNNNIEIGANNGGGPFVLQDVWSLSPAGGNGIICSNIGTGNAVNGILGINVTSEHQPSGFCALLLTDLSGVGAATGWCFINTHIEQRNTGAGTRCVEINGVSRVKFMQTQLLANSPSGHTGFNITNNIRNVGIDIDTLTNSNLISPIISDNLNNITYTALQNPISYKTPDLGYFPFKAASLTYAASMTPNMSDGNYRTVLVTDTNPFAFETPTNAANGMTLTFLIVNLSGGVIGSIAWNGFPYVNFVPPANNKRKTITFIRLSGTWTQLGDASPDL